MKGEDESAISEINILPDGRVCVFGASRQVLEILDAIPLGDAALRDRIECLRATEMITGKGTEEIFGTRRCDDGEPGPKISSVPVSPLREL